MEIGTGSRITVVCAMNRVVLTKYNGDQMSHEMCVAKIKRKPKGRDGSAHHKQLQSETKKREKRGIPTDHREEDTTRRISLIQKRQRKER
ncbi:hypothetical protein TNCV_1713911 [Trichonephila clavipes]|nr:hypothetical protein TNCV_1713911 [Trichonephila clavipes]